MSTPLHKGKCCHVSLFCHYKEALTKSYMWDVCDRKLSRP